MAAKKTPPKPKKKIASRAAPRVGKAREPRPAAAPPKPKPRPARAPADRKGVAAGGLDAGAKVPAFTLPDQDGKHVSSASLSGSPYVLYFYPKDDTPGCTREACGFRDELAKFRAAGVRVIGVSPDKPESHARFRDKYRLPFPLLSDADRTLAKAFGVWVLKQNYGREYMGIQRSTFLVDAGGRVGKVWRSVKVDGHVQKVLEAALGS